jgi:hypothetical protein
MLILRLRNYTIKDRVAEWFMGGVLSAMGVGILLQPTIFTANPVFAEFPRVAGPPEWGLGLLVVGVCRLATLTINGAWRKSPHLRMVMAGLSMLVWYQMSALSWEANTPNLNVVIYPAMLLLEIYCVYFAACDAGLSDEAAKIGRE